jgi:antitoxin VapB
MSEGHHAKVFKSGNSLALRLPKAFGLTEGTEMLISRDARGRLYVRPAEHAHVELAELFGSFSADFMASGREVVDAPDREWADPARRVA